MRTWAGLVSAALTLHALALPSHAADPTAEALRARGVRDVVRLTFSPGEGWKHKLDDDPIFRTLDSPANLSATRPIALAYSNFNPLVIDLEVAETVVDTTGAKQLEDFLGTLAGFPGLVGVPLTSDERAQRIRDDRKTRGFEEALRILASYVNDPVIDQQTLRAWVAKATGRAGVVDVSGQMSAGAADLKQNIADIEKAYGKMLGFAEAEEQVYLLRLIDVDGRIAAKRALLRQLTDLAKRLQEVGTASSWIDDTDYLFAEVKPREGKIVTASVTAVTRSYSLEAGELSANPTTHKTKLAVLGFRHHSRFIPEVAAGLVVANLRRPQYGTAESDGQTVVERLDDEKVDFSGALLLNAVCDCFGSGSFLQPMLQFGIAGGTETPSLLFGIGVRFTRVQRLALSGGAVLAWIHDLESLSPGDPVDGTAAIQDDLGLRTTVKAYFALQYTF